MSKDKGMEPKSDRGLIRFCWLMVAVAVLMIGWGCIGYRLGSTLPKGLNSIHVPTFVNKCEEPQAENECTKAAIQEFQKDGTLRIAGEDQADLLLDATLVKYTLEPLRYERNDPKTTMEYRLNLTADLVLTETKTKKTLVKRQVTGQSTFYPGNDLTSAKRIALPTAAADLAHNIVESVVEAW
jgi:hypothetical protein